MASVPAQMGWLDTIVGVQWGSADILFLLTVTDGFQPGTLTTSGGFAAIIPVLGGATATSAPLPILKRKDFKVGDNNKSIINWAFSGGLTNVVVDVLLGKNFVIHFDSHGNVQTVTADAFYDSETSDSFGYPGSPLPFHTTNTLTIDFTKRTLLWEFPLPP